MPTEPDATDLYYRMTTMCPHCGQLMPGEVRRQDGGVFVTRTCPTHGPIDALVCSDVAWYEGLARFDVPPVKPARPRTEADKGCPEDCGLCPAHRQSAGTTAIEISNRCNASCPVCLADNQGTFELSPAEVSAIVDRAVAAQGRLDVVTLSGGEPTIHPRFFEILDVLTRPEVGRIAVNSNGRRIAEDDDFVRGLARPNVYVSLHYDGAGAPAIRGVDFALQRRALERLCAHGVAVVPVTLAVKDINDHELGALATDLLRRPQVKSLILSVMAYTGRRGSDYPFDPRTRLTIPAALDAIEAGSGSALARRDFMPLPMPNPLCAAVGYFLVDEAGIAPLLPAAGVDRMIEAVTNAHFAKPDERFERFFRETVDAVYADPAAGPGGEELLGRFKRFLGRLFPAGRTQGAAARQAIAEESIKTVYLMQFMDGWTFDSRRLQKCSCQHLFADGVSMPSCGYYAYHRARDPRFAPQP
ncbi:MAG TPA: radical SAM protein [Polyangia bacterium]|jgi:hypothetical protein